MLAVVTVSAFIGLLRGFLREVLSLIAYIVAFVAALWWGPDVAGWGRVGDRVQAWLRKPAREAVVRWSGALAAYRPPAAGETPPDPV